MIIILTVLFGMFCAAMEALITAAILPSIISSLGGMHLYPWVINSFGLSFILAAPFFGKLCDIYGYKRIYLTAVSIFLTGSLLCGFAQSMTQLIASRAVQGVGSAGLITLCMVYFGYFPIEKRAKMQAMVSVVWSIASIIGPLLGATLTEAFSWRWAFYVNVPAALLVMLSMAFFAKPVSVKRESVLDIRGALLFICGMIPLLYALFSFGKLQISPIGIASAFFGISLLIYFVVHSLKLETSFIPIRLLQNPFILNGIILGSMAGFFIFCVSNFLPLFIQGVLGETATISGKVIVAMAFGTIVGASISGGLLNRLGFRTIALIGSLLLASGFALLTQVYRESTLFDLGLACFLVGAGVSALANCGIIVVQAGAPKILTGSATSLFQFSRGVGSVIGIAIMGGLQYGQFKRGIERVSSDPVLAEISATPQKIFNASEHSTLLPEQLQSLKDALAVSIQDVFIAGFFIGILAIVIAIRMSPKKPKELADTAIPDKN
jgi:MFS family permease